MVSADPMTRRVSAAAVTNDVMSALRRIIRAIDLHSRKLVQRYGLTGPQLVVLKELVARSPCTVGELARAVNLSQATVTGILDRLEKKSMVTRVRSTHDRRKVLVSHSEAAREVLAGAPPLLQDHFIDAFGGLPDWEQHQILASLQRLVALMEAGDVEAGPILTTGPLDASPEGTEAFLGAEGAPPDSP
jgi:DNA-binding MarR family transcriptional regulator